MPRPIRVLVVNDYGELGGAEVVANQSVEGLRDIGVEVSLFTGDGAGVRRSPVGYLDSRPARGLLRAELEKHRPNVVHLHNFYHLLSPGILATLARFKREGRGPIAVVATAHDAHLVCPNPSLLRYTRGHPEVIDTERRPLVSNTELFTRVWDRRGPLVSAARSLQHLVNYRVLARHRTLDAIFAPSRWYANLLARVGPKVRFVPNPVDTGPRAAPPPADPVSADTRNDRFTLLFVGRVEPDKGLALFIERASRTGFRLEVVGTGSDLERCKRIAVERGVEAVFYGRLAHTETKHRIAQTDALVLPSVWPENAPLVLFEAVAAGTPVIASNLGGIPEIIEEFRAGWCFDPTDSESVCSAIDAARREHDRGPDASQQERIALTAAETSRLLADRSTQAHAITLVKRYREILDAAASD